MAGGGATRLPTGPLLPLYAVHGASLLRISSGTATTPNTKRKRKMMMVTLSDATRKILEQRRSAESGGAHDDTRSGFIERLIREGQIEKPFPYRVLVELSAEDGVYVARVPAFEALVAHGGTPEDAAREARVAAEAMLVLLKQHKRAIPEPDLGGGQLPSRMKPHEEPSAESLREMPEVDFSKAVGIRRRDFSVVGGPDRRVTLGLLRKALGKTQVDVARVAGIEQGDVSRLEARADMKVSTLTRYAAAIGGELDVAVVIGGRRYRLDV